MTRLKHGGKRDGAGRPRSGDKPRTVTRSICFDEDSLEALDAIAAGLGLSRSATISKLISDASG